MFWILIGIYAAAILAWPLMSYGAIFAFDDPNGNRALAWYIAASIWLYPAFVVVGFIWGYPARNTHLLAIVLKTSVPLLSAMWFFLVPSAVALTLAWIREPSLEQVVRNRQELSERLDPIYTERTAVIRGRNPEEDAMEAIRRGDLALLPHETGTANYIGIDGPPPRDAETNGRVIESSEYLANLVALLSDDPAHPKRREGNVVRSDYVAYWTPTYQDYLAARRDYMTRFNTVVARHLAELVTG